MSLEAAIAENTAALHEVAVLLKAGNAGRTEAIKAASALQENKVAGRPPGSKNKKTETTTATDAPATPGPGGANKDTVIETPKPAATTAPSSDTLTQAQQEKIRNLVGGWLGKDDDLVARKERAAPIRKILDEVGAEKSTQVSPADFDSVIAKIEAVIAEGSSEEDSLL